MKLNKAKKILIASIVLFLFILILDIIFSNLLLNKIINVNNKIKQQNISNEERERNLALKESINDSQTERLELEKYFVGPGDSQTASFIGYFEELVKKAGLVSNIRSVGYEGISELGSDSAVSSIRLKFNVTGKWSNIYSFLKTIENLPKAAIIKSVSLTANTKGWSAEVDLSVARLNN